MTVTASTPCSRGSSITVDGLRLHVERGGEGPGLLCLHGIGSASASFLPQIAGLQDVRDVVAWDAPGYAGSDDPAHAPGMTGYADLAAELVRELWDGPVDVLGASWGGVIATTLALRQPGLVRRLVLVDSTRGSARSTRSAAAMRQRATDLAEVGPRAFACQRTPRLLSPKSSAELREAAQGTMAESIRLPGYGYAAQSMAETWLDADLARVAAPTLVVCGADDIVTGPVESAALAEGIPDARLVVVPDAGHLANQEAPEAVNEAVRRFLTDSPDSSTPTITDSEA